MHPLHDFRSWLGFFEVSSSLFMNLLHSSLTSHTIIYRCSHYFCSVSDLRKVYPYYFTFTTFTKGRWVGEKILDVFAREFRAHPAEEYVSGLIHTNHAPSFRPQAYLFVTPARSNKHFLWSQSSLSAWLLIWRMRTKFKTITKHNRLVLSQHLEAYLTTTLRQQKVANIWFVQVKGETTK